MGSMHVMCLCGFVFMHASAAQIFVARVQELSVCLCVCQGVEKCESHVLAGRNCVG